MTIKRTKIVYKMSDLPSLWHRRLLRRAVHARDPSRLRSLVHKGFDVNMPISDVFHDTPLTYAVKCGFLETVEALVALPQCDLDQCNRNKHSALDEALCVWLLAANNATEAKQVLGKRYRILRCLLAAGARRLTLTFLDTLVFSSINARGGHLLLAKLVRVFSEKGCPHVKSLLLSVLVPYRHTSPLLWTLAMQGARPESYLLKVTVRPFIPLDNAILLIKLTNDPRVLRRVDIDTSWQLESAARDWPKYKLLLRLLTLSGHSVQPHVMNYLYGNHADIYAWIAGYSRSPRKLSHLCRIVVRLALKPSVPLALSITRQIPQTLKPCLVFDKVL